MKRFVFLLALPVAVILAAAITASGEAQTTPASDDIERGEYLSRNVAMCVQCHSPRNAQGAIIETREFRGAPMPVKSPYPEAMPFALQAPNIAGLTGYTDAEAIRLLTKGIAKRGDAPQAPMPPFRMTEEDAKAIVAYLRSL